MSKKIVFIPQKCCNPDCNNIVMRHPNPKVKRKKGTAKTCSKECRAIFSRLKLLEHFENRSQERRDEISIARTKPKEFRICEICGGAFVVTADKPRKGVRQKFCSLQCSFKDNTRNSKISASRIEMNNKVWGCGTYNIYNPFDKKINTLQGSYELRWAHVLTLRGEPWISTNTYRHAFTYIDNDLKLRTYRPDFYNPRDNIYYEVKGWMSPESIVKINAMKPQIDLRVITIQELMQGEAEIFGDALCKENSSPIVVDEILSWFESLTAA